MAQTKTATAKKTTGKRKTTPRSAKPAATRGGRDAGSETVTIDRRRNKEQRNDGEGEAMEKTSPAAPTMERRKKVSRRRQIDPTTCERDYTDQEVEFMNALDEYKRKSGRMFPTCSEVLEVINTLGYVKLTAAEMGAGSNPSIASAKPMSSQAANWAEQETISEIVS